MNLNILNIYASISDQLTNRDITAESLTGFISCEQENIEKIITLSKYGICSSVTELWDNTEVIEKGFDLEAESYKESFSQYKIKVDLVLKKIHSDFFICNNWNTLLAYPEYLLKPIQAVYLIDTQELITNENKTKEFERYLKASKICKFIADIANTKNSDTEYVIIFGQALSISFSDVTLNDIQYDMDVNTLSELLRKDLHQEAKTSLVREALVSFLKDKREKHRFGYLLTHFNAFSTQILIGYEQFVSNYTFDKVRREHQEKRTEYIGRLNKVFDEVATKALAIPAGIWLAISQIKETALNSFDTARNAIYVLILFTLIFIVIANICGQFAILRALKDEYTSLFERLRHKKGALNSDIQKIKRELDERESIIFNKLTGTIIIVVLLCVLACSLCYIAMDSLVVVAK